MSIPYCVCAEGIWCEACHEEMCADAVDDLEQECADRENDEWEGLADASY